MGIFKDILGIKSPSELAHATIGGNHLDPHQAAGFTPPPMPINTGHTIPGGTTNLLIRQTQAADRIWFPMAEGGQEDGAE